MRRLKINKKRSRLTYFFKKRNLILLVFFESILDLMPSGYGAFTHQLPQIIHFLSQAVWPDFTKFRHFGKILKSLAIFLRVHLVFVKILNLLQQIFHPIGLIYIVGNGQIFNKQSTHLVLLVTRYVSLLMKDSKYFLPAPVLSRWR